MHIGRKPDAVHGNRPCKCFLDLRIERMAATDIRRKNAGCDSVDGDVVCGKLQGRRTHEVSGAGLGSHVGGSDRRLDARGGEGSGQDDTARFPGPHVASRSAHGCKDPVQIDVDDPIPALVGVVFQSALAHPGTLGTDPRSHEAHTRIDPGICEDCVESAVCARGARN